MNDWWNYLEHSGLGKERKGHKYYARVQTGTNTLGFPKYRYFYDAREYGAYMTNKRDPKSTKAMNARNDYGNKNSTYYVTGKGSRMLSGSAANASMYFARRGNIYDEGTLYAKSGRPGGKYSTESTKTVKDHKKLRKVKRDMESIYQRGKDAVARLITHNTNITFLDDMSKKDRAKAVKNWGKKSTSSKNQKSIIPKNTTYY